MLKSKLIRSRKLKGEQFLDLGDYALSNYGRWYSYRFKRIMRQQKNSSGYYRVKLYIAGTPKQVFTHIKVVELFGDTKGEHLRGDRLINLGLSIDHIDGNKKHNMVSNLEIVSHSENCIRRSRRMKECKKQKMQ